MFRVYYSTPSTLPPLSTDVRLFPSGWLWGPFHGVARGSALFRDIRVFRVPWLRETKGQQWAQTRSQPYLLLCYSFHPSSSLSFFPTLLSPARPFLSPTSTLLIPRRLAKVGRCCEGTFRRLEVDAPCDRAPLWGEEGYCFLFLSLSPRLYLRPFFRSTPGRKMDRNERVYMDSTGS